MHSMRRMMQAMAGPDWRWRLAQRLAVEASVEDDVTSVHAIHKDNSQRTIQLAANYLRGQAAGKLPAELAAQYPLVVAAFDVQLAPLKTEAMKLYTLADVSRVRIAKACNLSVEVIRAWERLFFDVRPLLTMPAAIAAVTVTREIGAGNTELAAKMKLAISGGVLAVELMQRVDVGALLSEADAIFQRELQLDLRAQQALCMPLESESARVRYQMAYMDYSLKRARIELARQRLRTRCEIMRAKLEVERLRLAQERLEQAASKVVNDDATPAEATTISEAHQKTDAA